MRRRRLAATGAHMLIINNGSLVLLYFSCPFAVLVLNQVSGGLQLDLVFLWSIYMHLLATFQVPQLTRLPKFRR